MMNAAILTKRETEIAELLAWGATKKDVANRLFVSERTVENHTRNIFEKVGVTKVTRIVRVVVLQAFQHFFKPFTIETESDCNLLAVLGGVSDCTRPIHRSDNTGIRKDYNNPRSYIETQRG